MRRWNDFGKGIGQNIARGIIPTTSRWDTPPSDLENATDGNLDTATGIGSTTTEGSGDYGIITFDFGKNRLMMILALVDLWSDAGNTNAKIKAKTYGNGDYEYSYPITNEVGAWEGRKPAVVIGVYARYIQIVFNVNTATTAYGKIYELIALEVIP